MWVGVNVCVERAGILCVNVCVLRARVSMWVGVWVCVVGNWHSNSGMCVWFCLFTHATFKHISLIYLNLLLLSFAPFT